MIRHIVMWKIKKDIPPFEKQQLMLTFKHNMNNLNEMVSGIKKLEVIINELDSSNMDMMLISEFETKAVLVEYQQHPKHKAASKCLVNMIDTRSCIDYEYK